MPEADAPRTGTLHLVPVPIGHRDDITLRAIETLRAAGIIAAEDTRDFAELRRLHGLEAPVVSYHDHNETSRARELVERLRSGTDVALVSDAGMPLISDPGYRLVRAAIAAGIPVTSLPGASAVTTALVGSGLAPQPFRFCGFPPRTAGRRRSFFAALRDDDATLVLFEAPHRLAATLADAASVLGVGRAACLARNLTKPHERYERGTLGSLASALAAEGDIRGEATVIIAGAEKAGAPAEAEAEAAARVLLAAGAGQRPVVALLVRHFGLRRRDAYELVLHLDR